MKIRYGRLGSIAALTAVAALTSAPLMAGQEVSIADANAESSLLGLRLMKSTFRDVLKTYGQPSEIQAGGPYSPTAPPGATSASGGGGAGGGMGMMGMGGGGMSRGMPGGMSPTAPGSGGGAPGMGGGGGSKRQTSKNGFPGSNGGGGGGGKMGGPGSGGMPTMGGKMGGPGSGGPGMMGGPNMGAPGSGGLPGFGPNSPAGGGGEGGEGGSEAPGTGTDNQDNPPLKETTWWYHDHQNGLHIAFVFNRVGQIIQIGEYGPKKLTKMHGVPVPSAGATRRGLVLGNSLGQVIGKYGWSLDGAHDAENVIMRFGRTDKIAFQMVNNAILGITIGVTH